MRDRAGQPPFRHRLGFRLGLIVFLVFVVIELLMFPVWTWLLEVRYPEWWDPEFLRSYLGWLEGDPSVDASQFESTGIWDPVLVLVVFGYVALQAALFAILVSVLATRRLRRLTRQVAAPPANAESLPGPFDVRGHDEIRFLAVKMNAMRERIAGLLDRVEERDRVRSEWVSHVSHDLRTPLTALTALIDRGRSLLPTLEPESGRRELARLLDSAELDTRRITDLAEDLLEIARLEVSTDLIREPVPPGELVRAAAQELAPVAESRDLRFESSCPPNLPELHADGRRLMRAVENITLNSLQHARAAVRLSARQSDSRLEILVEDDGPGLPETGGEVVLGEIGRDPDRRDSTGIGLEVAQRIIAAHGGEISAANRAQGGAAVRVSLPLHETQ